MRSRNRNQCNAYEQRQEDRASKTEQNQKQKLWEMHDWEHGPVRTWMEGGLSIL